MPEIVDARGFFCGLPCSPLSLEIEAGAVVGARGGCPACRDGLASPGAPREARLAGEPAGDDRAIAAALRLLRAARAPFIYGLACSSNATARLAARIAESLGAALDLEGGEALHPDLTSLQTFGLPSASFGEIRNRADLILFWRCDPRATHPHLFGRRAGTPLEPGGERRIILAPPADGPPAEPADLTLPIEPGGDLGALLALRAHLAGRAPRRDGPGRTHGEAPQALDETLRTAADRIRQARYAAILWDARATAGPLGTAVSAALTLLAADLNRSGRGCARPLGSGNLAGAMASLGGQAGAPRAIGFSGGTPRFGPSEFGARRWLSEGRADLCLLIGARSAPRASRGAQPKTIVIGPRLPGGLSEPDVLIPTALWGLSAAGTGRRVDNLPVVLRAVLPSGRPGEEQVLGALAAGLRAEARS